MRIAFAPGSGLLHAVRARVQIADATHSELFLDE
jgi:hypothetical protein